MQTQIIINDKKNMEMEDYLYEKKKKFEMMKNRNKIMKSNSNLSSKEINLQTRQCERRILKNYDFKSKSTDLAPMKQKVMLKKRQSTEKSLTINHSENDDSCFTNTIYLQEDEFSLDGKMNKTNLLENAIQSSDETINNINLDLDDIFISKRESSLSFQQTPSIESFFIEMGSSLQDSTSIIKDGVSSYGGLNQKQNSNSTIVETGKLQKKKSLSSFLQTSGLFKRVKSLIQTDDMNVSDTTSLSHNHRSLSTNNFIANVDMESKHKKKSRSKSRDRFNSTDEKLSSNENNNASSIKSHKKTFSLSSFKLKPSKSNVSINNDRHSINSNTTAVESSKKSLTHRDSVTKSIMKKINSLSKINKIENFSMMGSRKASSTSFNNHHNDDDSPDHEKKFLFIKKKEKKTNKKLERVFY